MRNFNLILLTAISIVTILSSCSSTNSLTISVVEPAPVNVSPDVNKVGVINRSVPTETPNKIADAVDKIISIEGETFDEDGAKEAILGLSNELLMGRRFDNILIIDSMNVRNPGLGVFPSPLNWTTVDNICRKNNVDAVFELSFYDTDTEISYDTYKVDSPLGLLGYLLEHHAVLVTHIKTGWRLYDPVSRIIQDEIVLTNSVVSEGVGINPVKAVEAIMGRKEAVLDVSNRIGHTYGTRLIPFRIRVKRDYFVKGNNNFEVAKRMAQTGNWDGAAEIWAKEVNNPDTKLAGRACYNMAIISEINGDLDAAMEWAAKSYTQYENYHALEYLDILKYRKEKNKQLQSQVRKGN